MDPEDDYDYFEGRHVDVRLEHERRVNIQVNIRFLIRQFNDPFAVSLPEFCKNYRMPQHLVMNLCRRLAPYMPASHNNIRYLPLEIKVLCALAFYGHGSYQRVVGMMSSISVCQASVSNALAAVTDALNHNDIMGRFIRFPANCHEREFTIARNKRLGLPRVLGYIDGTLIKIVPPPRHLDREVYFGRKGFPCLNTQIVCDADLYIMDINARFPGSANDPYVYRQSGIRELLMEAYRESRCWLLGDSIYPLEPWLQTPIPHAVRGTPEFRFTQVHCQNRNPVERCNGVLKGRWRCCLWDRTLHYMPEKAGSIINACAVLHNFCILNNLPLEEEEVAPPDDMEDDENNEELEHEAVEQNLREQALAERQFLINHVQARWRRRRRERP